MAVSRAKFNERGLSFEGKRESTGSARKAKAKGETNSKRREEKGAKRSKRKSERSESILSVSRTLLSPRWLLLLLLL